VSRGLESGVDSTTFHSGKASLRLTGVQGSGWNYTSHSLRIPVLPVSRYRLSFWIRVNKLEPSRLSPYLKLGLTDVDGKWLANLHTGRYDMRDSGNWQRLEATFETTGDTAGGHLALERGDHDASTRIDLWLDDVTLELLEAP
jgi:hypothetical protein